MTAQPDTQAAPLDVASVSTSTVALSAGSVALRDRCAVRLHPRGTLYALDLTGAGTPRQWVDTVEQPSRLLLNGLSQLATAPGQVESVTVVVHAGVAGRLDLTEAAVEAIRGVVGSAALEFGPQRIRVNTLVLAGDVPVDDIYHSITYLSDPQDGGYTTGATLRLTQNAVAELAPTADGYRPRPVLVTGAAGGIGRAAAERLIAAGYPVVLADLATPNLNTTSHELGVPAVSCNVTDPKDVEVLLNNPHFASGLGGLIILHGVGGSTGLDNFDHGVSERSLRINGTAVDTLVRAALPLLVSPSSIVVLSSQAGLTAEAGNAAYCAPKFAVVGYAKRLAEQLADQGVRVQVLCPGPVDTPLMRNAFAGLAAAAGVPAEDFLADRLAQIPLGGAGTPAQMAAATLLLTQLRSTGVVLAPTGGETLS